MRDRELQPEEAPTRARPAGARSGEWQATGVPAVTALQQSAGNRAIALALAGRATRGDAAGASAFGGKGTPIDDVLAGRPGERALQREDEAPAEVDAGGESAGKARATQTVDITTVNGPKDLGRGGYSWKVWFGIGSAAGEAGWVIQEVTATFTKTGPGAAAKAYHFWEAWQVDKGKKVTVWQDKGLDDNDDLYYAAPSAAKTKGVNKLVGVVKFYEGALPADFVTNNPGTIAGILHSTTTKPPFWDGGGTAHDITATWDDTGATSTASVDAVAGTTKLKGTP